MDLGINGRKAIVAGASTGMGKESAFALAREGVELYISARNEPRLVAVAQEIADTTGTKVTPVVADHSTMEGRNRLLEACPVPDILVITCSPPRFVDSYREIEPGEWMDVLSTTFLGPVELMRATIDGMKNQGFGRIVNIATIGAKTGSDTRVLSGAPRAALCNYAAATARPLAKFNIAINTILPGMFETKGAFKLFGDLAQKNGSSYQEEVDKWFAKTGIPAARFGDTADVGALCAMLCSQHASYIIGQSIVIDGGLMRSVF